MNFLRSIWQSINNIIAAPGRFIEAANVLSSSVQEQTRTIEALRSDVLKTTDLHHHELRRKLETLVTDSNFQVRVKKAELGRAGHRAD
jgi:hypothetical protein